MKKLIVEQIFLLFEELIAILNKFCCLFQRRRKEIKEDIPKREFGCFKFRVENDLKKITDSLSILTNTFTRNNSIKNQNYESI